MTQLPRKRAEGIAKTRGPLRIIRPGQPDVVVRKGRASTQAARTLREAYEASGRQPYD